jgi:SAM-dependent methyltransferase
MTEQDSHRQNWVRSLLQCPHCRSAQIQYDREKAVCTHCENHFRIIAGRCVFHQDTSISHVDYDRRDFQLPLRFIEMIKRKGGLALNMGSGAQPENLDYIIDFDYMLCPATDVVGDGHFLPFQDNLFDSVISLNVFEHLNDPQQAVREIQRVCKPDGLLIIHTAFMQPQHDFVHFFNATRAGVQEWFAPYFSELSCTVSPNFSVEKTMAWVAHDFLEMIRRYCPEETVNKFENMSMKEFETIWKDLYSDNAQELYKLIKDIPDEGQEILALGFEFTGIKRTDRHADI